jgi:hypothetical protein
MRGLIRSRPGSMYAAALVAFVAATVFPLPSASPFSVSHVEALPSKGLRIRAPSLVRSGIGPGGLNETGFVEGRFSIEVVVSATGTEATGPARIVAYSIDPSRQNWIVGQEGSSLAFRHRGRRFGFPAVFRPGEAQRLLISIEAGMVSLAVDGRHHSAQPVLEPARPWDSSARFVLGNEATGDRPWSGEIHSLRLFSPAVPLGEESEASERYALRIPSVDRVELRALDGEIVPLERVPWPWAGKLRSALDWRTWAKGWSVRDVVQNFLGTIPLGFLLAGFLLKFPMRRACLYVLVAASQGLVSVAVELIQLVSMFRHGDVTDVLLNVAGATVGIALWNRTRSGLSWTKPRRG